MQDSLILRKNKDVVGREVDNETILIPMYKSSKDLNSIYSLNDVASKVWKMIDGKKSIGQIKKQISRDFDATETEIERELSKLIKDLKSIKAILPEKE